MDNLEKLKAYQVWRRGGESSIFDTMTTTEIGSVIDWAIDKCEQSEQIERERDQLKAQVDKLEHDNIALLTLALACVDEFEFLNSSNEPIGAYIRAYDCLAKHDAEVAAKAVEGAADYAAGLISDKYGIAKSGSALEILNHKTDVVLCIAEYANQIRQQAKSGE